MDTQAHKILSECLFLKNNRLSRHFVRYVMHDQVQERRYLVLQYLDTSLVDRILDLDYGRRLEAIVEYAKEVLLAIKEVHGTNHVHCDIRPSNIRFGNG
jgi:serine/threonine protein kinase